MVVKGDSIRGWGYRPRVKLLVDWHLHPVFDPINRSIPFAIGEKPQAFRSSKHVYTSFDNLLCRLDANVVDQGR
jgi:hypothetical protein